MLVSNEQFTNIINKNYYINLILCKYNFKNILIL